MKHYLCTAVLLLAAPALANDKQDFADCDGRNHPGKQDDGMRGESSISAYDSFRFGSGLSPALLGAVRGLVADNGRVAACTRALASPRLLPTQALRKAHLLRARGAAHLQGGNVDLATLDLDAAEAALADRTADPFYQRSMGASLKLLRAIALAQQGKWDDARALAATAREARPYSLRLQNVAAEILAAAPDQSGAPSPWNGVLRLDPAVGHRALQDAAKQANHADVLRLAPAVDTAIAFPDPAPLITGFQPALPLDAIKAMFSGFAIAHARAATGDLAGAKRFRDALAAQLTDRKVRLDARDAAAVPPAGAGPTPAALAAADPAAPPPPARPRDPILTLGEQRLRLLDLRIAQVEGRVADARAMALGSALPVDGSTIEVFTRLNAALPAKDRLPVPDLAALTEKARQNDQLQLRQLAQQALIAPETPHTVIDYSKSRPNILGALVGGAVTMGFGLLGGIDRTDGFRSTPQADGTIKVEFVGNTPSEPLVQEMTLLRAAEMAQAAGRWGFAIARRADYTRYLVTSRGGFESSRVPTGHKTELFIRYVNDGEDPLRGFGAVSLIDALGPLYYEDKPGKR